MGLNWDFAKKTFNLKMATFGGVLWGGGISLSYYFCSEIPLEIISNAKDCGNYSAAQITLPGIKQGTYAFLVTGPLSRICDDITQRRNFIVATFMCSAFTTTMTLANHKWLIESPNYLQPTLLGGIASLIAYGAISTRKKILPKRLENILD